MNTVAAPPLSDCKAFHVVLVRPSKYDDEGYVLRYVKGVLPSNTLGVLAALTRRAFNAPDFAPGVRTSLSLLDDTIERVDVRRLAKRHLGKGRRAVVAFAAVQTNQFPRAADLALRFREAGFDVMIGGFHVSGSIALSEETPPECAALMERGVTLVKGEVEDAWEGLLRDSMAGRLQPFYEVVEKPDIAGAPLPEIDWNYQKKFLYKYCGTLDTSRGCPYNCSFCTIINVQGRKMRCRSAETVVAHVAENYRRRRINYYFITDDNFSRNRHWEAILDGFAALRESEAPDLQFMMQVDTQAWKIPRFIEKAAAAGCSQVFLGVESLNPKNIEAADKGQNAVEEIGDMVDAWHAAEVACHAGYIVGFPFDTTESVAQDVENLKAAHFDQCSFFMLTPLPGSVDHRELLLSDAWLDPDLNHYDSNHEAMRLPNFEPGEWSAAYWDAWRRFCNPQYARETLERSTPSMYWSLLKNYMWYRNAVFEGVHPMLSGFWRLRDRTDRRPGYRVDGRLRHSWRRLRETFRNMGDWAKLYVELQRLWLETRIPDEKGRTRLEDLRSRVGAGVADWSDSIGARAGEMRRSIRERSDRSRQWMRDGAGNAAGRVRSRWAAWREAGRQIPGWNPREIIARNVLRWNALMRPRMRRSRAGLDAYWKRLGRWGREKRVLRITVESPRIAFNALRELNLSAVFLICFLREVRI